MGNHTPQRYTKRPVTIDAMQWDGTAEGATPIIDWILSGEGTARYRGPDDGDPNCPNRFAHAVRQYCPSCSYVAADPAIAIDTLEGTITASPSDWIIRGVAGEFYPCRDDIFQRTYEIHHVVDTIESIQDRVEKLQLALADAYRDLAHAQNRSTVRGQL
jgi:hypothetical protein